MSKHNISPLKGRAMFEPNIGATILSLNPPLSIANGIINNQTNSDFMISFIIKILFSIFLNNEKQIYNKKA